MKKIEKIKNFIIDNQEYVVCTGFGVISVYLGLLSVKRTNYAAGLIDGINYATKQINKMNESVIKTDIKIS